MLAADANSLLLDFNISINADTLYPPIIVPKSSVAFKGLTKGLFDSS